MSSPDEKKTGRRGAGRGRRQATGASEEVPGRGAPPPPSIPVSAPGEGVAGGRGRGRTATAEAKATSPERTSSGDVSPKGSPPGSDVVEKMAKLELIELANRPGFGVTGTKIKVLANYFEMQLEKELIVVHYHIEVKHTGQMKLNRDEKRFLFFTCVQQNPNVFGSPFRLGYDAAEMCIALDRLKFPGGGAGGKFVVHFRLPRMKQAEDFSVDVSITGTIHVDLRQARTTGAASDRYSTPLHVLDLIIRQGRSYPLNENIVKKWYSYQSTIYKIPLQGGDKALTCGRVIWQGLFGATKVGQNWIPHINFDVSHSGFYRPQSCLEYLVEVLNSNKDWGGGFNVGQLNANTLLRPDWLQAFRKAMRNLKVHFEAKTREGQSYERDYTIIDVSQNDATNHPLKNRDGTVRMSVAQYFNERYGQLQYPKLNVLIATGSKNLDMCPALPLEHCTILSRQRVKKLGRDDTSLMIRAAAMNAPSRKSKIDELVHDSSFSADPWLKQFGVKINPQMKAVDARILPAPRIIYAQGNGGGGNAIADVREGVWDMRGRKFFMGATCQEIGALVMDNRDQSTYMNFFNFLLTTCRDLGMNVPSNIQQQHIRAIGTNNIQGIEAALTELHKLGAKFIIVTLPQKDTNHYNEVKRVAEIILGVMTQCVLKNNVRKCLEKNDRMLAANLALKMNTKMGGINSKTDADNLAKKALFEEPTLVIGIDVTHPGPTSPKMPSISAVVANIDDTFMRYGATVRVQRHSKEGLSTAHLYDMVKKRLLDYREFVVQDNKRTGQKKPEKCSRLLVFRDGVDEGQFQSVLANELSAIRQCCRDLDANYNPKITLIVANKRHHTRYFPGPGGPQSGKAMNVPPGTVVDKDITHPEQFEFFLCSHFGIQGVSRPTRYNILLDENGFSSDHIQVMVYYLCHVYARCTRAVSIPAPIYYADLACRRARAHIYEKIDFGSDTLSQSSGSGGSSDISENEWIRASSVKADLELRMYFV